MLLGHKQKAVKTNPTSSSTTPDDDNVDADEIDRISELPDSLLCHILSFIPTKEAAVTSLLSTRWRYVFTSLPDIDLQFCFTNDSPAGIDMTCDLRFFSFINFGYRVLLLRTDPSVRKFRLSVQNARESSLGAIDALLSTALLVKVEDLEILLGNTKFGHTNSLSPAGIFMYQALNSVKLDWPEVDFIVPASFCLPNLKLLHFGKLRLVDDDSIKRLIQGCPLLEDLKLSLTRFEHDHRDVKVKIVDISSPSLRKLVLDCSGAKYTTIVLESDSLESLDYQEGGFGKSGTSINAPNLKHLAYHGDLAGVDFVQTPKSLVSAKIMIPWIYGEERGQHALVLFKSVQNVKSLCLAKKFLEGLHDFEHWLSRFKNLIRLEIDYMPCCSILAKLIDSAPNIEELAVGQVALDNEFEDFKCPSSEVRATCFIEHLKEIEITKFCEEEYEFKVVEHLLQNGKALKKMTIGGFIKPSSCARIWSFKRSSEDCRILFAEWKIFKEDDYWRIYRAFKLRKNMGIEDML